ncbi:MAG: serine/threonine protein kinase, partial [Clostridia bacterium]|nr:serine/threonine protein kinase [Clostridia bacterium]
MGERIQRTKYTPVPKGKHMQDPNNICLGCMRSKINGEATCSRCGFNQENYEATRNPHWLPPQTILAGKYMVGKVIGEGGFGITYMGWDLNLEMPVAIKEYFPVGLITRDTSTSMNPTVSIMTGSNLQHFQKGMESFEQEARTLGKFQQMPGVVSVKDFFRENNTAYLVMELVRGDNLKEVLKKIKRPMAEDAVLKIMFPLLYSLRQIHQANIIHRDISPDNILVEGNKVTLIDFGAARIVKDDDPKSLTVLLKHGYAPAEQYQTRGHQGPWTDVYALCATIYRMTSGIIPQEAIERTAEDKLVPLKILRQQNPNIHVSDQFSDAIQKGLAISIEHRYQSIGELMDALYGKTQVVITEEPNTREYIEKKQKKQRNKIIGVCSIIMAAILAICAIAFAYYRATHEGRIVSVSKVDLDEYIKVAKPGDLDMSGATSADEAWEIYVNAATVLKYPEDDLQAVENGYEKIVLAQLEMEQNITSLSEYLASIDMTMDEWQAQRDSQAKDIVKRGLVAQSVMDDMDMSTTDDAYEDISD